MLGAGVIVMPRITTGDKTVFSMENIVKKDIHNNLC